jgi:hypothetical protein
MTDKATDHAESAAAPDPDPLLERLTRAVDGLFIMSETDSPLTPFRWPDFFKDQGNSKDAMEALRLYKKLPADTTIGTVTLEKFFEGQVEPDKEDDDEIKEEKRRLTELRDLLAKELSEAAVYRVGEINITAYIIGRVPDTNDAAGASAELVET